MSVVTLLTDFGIEDEYVGVMKGALLTASPQVTIVDLCHHIRPQDLQGAAHMLAAACRYFPPGTVHVAVVDPGVGSRRSIVALQVDQHYFVGPDNGIFTLVIDQGTVRQAVKVTKQELFLQPLSHTFHGRDIMAPVAAFLAEGKKILDLGTQVDQIDLTRLALPTPKREGPGILVGIITAIDRFGNLITNIRPADLEPLYKHAGSKGLEIHVGSARIVGLSDAYSKVQTQQPLALVGSRGYLEIAVNQGHAARCLVVMPRDQIKVTCRTARGGDFTAPG